MKNYNDLNQSDQEAYLMLLIINGLKKLGGQSSTKELKRSVVADNDAIPDNMLTDFRTSKTTGAKYLPFNYDFNFSVKHLILAGMLERPHIGLVRLTEKGRNFKGTGSELNRAVYKISIPIFKAKANKKKNKKANNKGKVETDSQVNEDEDIDNSSQEVDWRSNLLNALMNLSSAKFELFCRALVKKMNVDIDETIGTKLTGDGGLDGYGYITTDDFRTARVAIQAKRWSLSNSVSSPEIDKFRGAMDKFRAEYGIFITTSTFTRDAVKAARAGTRVITLIDGDRLLDLIAKYELYVTPVTITTYRLDKFFKEKN